MTRTYEGVPRTKNTHAGELDVSNRVTTNYFRSLFANNLFRKNILYIYFIYSPMGSDPDCIARGRGFDFYMGQIFIQ